MVYILYFFVKVHCLLVIAMIFNLGLSVQIVNIEDVSFFVGKQQPLEEKRVGKAKKEHGTCIARTVFFSYYIINLLLVSAALLFELAECILFYLLYPRHKIQMEACSSYMQSL